MIKYTFEGEYPPSIGTEASAGLDLCVQSYNNGVINTGVRVEIPTGWVGLLAPRSSWGLKGLGLKNTIGIIDSDYRGEIIIHTYRNPQSGYLNIEPGARVCQLVVVRNYIGFTQVDELSDTDRGENGFGSTGSK